MIWSVLHQSTKVSDEVGKNRKHPVRGLNVKSFRVDRVFEGLIKVCTSN